MHVHFTLELGLSGERAYIYICMLKKPLEIPN